MLLRFKTNCLNFLSFNFSLVDLLTSNMMFFFVYTRQMFLTAERLIFFNLSKLRSLSSLTGSELAHKLRCLRSKISGRIKIDAKTQV